MWSLPPVPLFFKLVWLQFATVASNYIFDTTNSFFSDTYAEADEKFRFVCNATAGENNLRTYTHPTHKGREGEPLMSRVCLLGNWSAPNVLYLMTGVHGVEGFVGAAAMLKMMIEMNNGGTYQIPENTRYVFHHMVEPWGASWGFKENEDNVDQLKNSNELYLDSKGWNRTNPISIEFTDALDIPHLDQYADTDPASSVLVDKYHEIGVKYGEKFGKALRKGQMERQVGIAYWGTARSWSSTVQRQVAADYLAGATKIVVLDLHTAVGKYGIWTIYACDRESEATFKHWIDVAGVDKNVDNLYLAGITLEPQPFYTYIQRIVQRIVPSAQVVRVIWEAGTYPPDQYQIYSVLGIHCRFYANSSNFTNADCAKNQKSIRHYFYPNLDDYKQIAMSDLEVTSKALFDGMRSWFKKTKGDDDTRNKKFLSNLVFACIGFACLLVGTLIGYGLRAYQTRHLTERLLRRTRATTAAAGVEMPRTSRYCN